MKIQLVILILAVVVFVVWQLQAKPSTEALAAAGEAIRQGALVLDVRTAGEYASGHYEGAVNIPLQGLETRLTELGPTNRTIVLYCRSGRRSQAAKRLLDQAGFQNVKDAGAMANMPASKPAP